MLNLGDLTDGDLTALTRALHEARFPEVERDPLVWTAPFVIDLHVAATEESRRRMELRGDSREIDRLEAWLQWRHRPEEQTLIRRLTEDPALRRLVLTGGVPFLRQMLRPFIVADEVAADLLKEVAHMNAN